MSDVALRLRAVGRERYQDKHPFHVAMHEGWLSPAELRRWAENRCYYQTRIPLKDALLVSKCEHRVLRPRTRVAAWERHYPFLDRDVLLYFRERPEKARRDARADAIAAGAP